MVGGLEAEHEQRVAAVAGHRERASPASSRRQLVGCSPDCESARTHSAPATKSAKRTPAEARCAGRGCTRTHASVITPSVPSEPTSMRSGLGPAPEPGSRREAQTPGGRDRARPTRRSPRCGSTRSRSGRRRAWRSSRRAWSSSNDCGKWRSVSPCSPSWASSAGPVAPAWMSAARETWSTSSTRSSAPRSIVTRRCRGADGGRDAADDAGAAAVGDRGDALGGAPLEQALDIGLVARARDEVGRVLEVPAEAAHDVAVGLAERVGGARVRVGASRSRRAPAGIATRGAASATRSRLTGCSSSPGGKPSCAASAGAPARSLLGRGLLVLKSPTPVLAPARCSRRASLWARRPACRFAARAEPVAQCQRSPPPSSAAEILARGPWELDRSAHAGATEHFEPSAGIPRRPTRRSPGCSERGSPSHDGLAARLVDFAGRRTASSSRCSRCAGRCDWSRATPRPAWRRCA